VAFMPTAVPSFVHFSWSFPVNWYIQSILYTPLQSSQSHSYQLRLSTCAIAHCSHPSLSYLPVAPKSLRQTRPSSLPPFTPPFFFRCYWLTTLSSEHTPSPIHAMSCILFTLLFGNAAHFFLSRNRENCVPFNTLFHVASKPLMTDIVSFLVACCLRLLSSVIEPFFITTTGYIASRLYVNPVLDFRFRHLVALSLFLPCLQFPYFFFSSAYIFYPFSQSSITIHELVTKRKLQCDDSFCLISASDPRLSLSKRNGVLAEPICILGLGVVGRQGSECHSDQGKSQSRKHKAMYSTCCVPRKPFI
jgi:hypothetical protein